MKRIFFITGIVATLLLSSSTLSAQIRKIPAEVTDSFNGKYPDAKGVEWRDRLTGFSATFTLDNTTYLASFDNKGEWQNTEHEIQQEELPSAVTDGLEKSKYAEWEIRKVDYIELSNGQIEYRIEVGSGDIKKRNLYFNSKGRLVKDKLTL
jgi:hypothetical protein